MPQDWPDIRTGKTQFAPIMVWWHSVVYWCEITMPAWVTMPGTAILRCSCICTFAGVRAPPLLPWAERWLLLHVKYPFTTLQNSDAVWNLCYYTYVLMPWEKVKKQLYLSQGGNTAWSCSGVKLTSFAGATNVVAGCHIWSLRQSRRQSSARCSAHTLSQCCTLPSTFRAIGSHCYSHSTLPSSVASCLGVHTYTYGRVTSAVALMRYVVCEVLLAYARFPLLELNGSSTKVTCAWHLSCNHFYQEWPLWWPMCGWEIAADKCSHLLYSMADGPEKFNAKWLMIPPYFRSAWDKAFCTSYSSEWYIILMLNIIWNFNKEKLWLFLTTYGIYHCVRARTTMMMVALIIYSIVDNFNLLIMV